jgi:serine/threonine-protein kinase
VAHLHAQGIVHRDLKPSNVLLDPDGRTRVTDFGLAKLIQSDANVTRSGAIIGTPCYMPPEQAAGRGGTVGPASDIYSLGAILFELITGRPPFTGQTPLDTIVQVLESEPPRPRRLRAGIPRPLEQICLHCLEREPGDRYPTASALAEDLDHFLRGEPIEARRVGAWHNLKRWARRQPALASRLGTMGILGLIYLASHWLLPSQPGETYRLSLAVVLAWALASILFEGLLHRQRWSDAARLGWAVVDVLMFTLLVHIHEGLSTSLVAGYFLLIAASGLWFREQLVWITTALSVFAYGALVFREGIATSLPPESPYRHVVFGAALAVSGLITSYQVKRVRGLSQYYEHRPLP